MTHSTSPLTIGNGDSPFGGTLDEVAVYDHTLSADRASYQYEAAQHGSYAQTHTYDEADRLTDPGYTYDPLGRTTTLPANDAGGQGTLTAGSRGALTATYYATDLARSLTQNGATTTYTLDPLRRTRTTATTGQAASTLQHYSDSTAGGSEAASWTETPGAATAWTRNLTGPDGMLAATQTSTGTVRLVLTDLHGSIVGTTDDTPQATPYPPNSASTEYGGATPSTTPTPRADVGPNRYSWLGGHQRDQDAPGDLTLMGQRLYNPATGRFLQTDPIPGGSANDYDYVNQDPVNSWDLNGRSCLCGTGSEGGEGYRPGAGGGYGTSAGEGISGARGGGGGAGPNTTGAAGEAKAAAELRRRGYTVRSGIGTQGARTVRTSYGYNRRYDLTATEPNGRTIYYVEVKTGPSSGLTKAQRDADADNIARGYHVVYIYIRPARGGSFL